MKIYNSMSMKLEEFQPLEEGKVSMYVCGPTVYNYPHIGNARPIVVFDTLKRTLQALGYEVKMVSNYTDVDDKIINVAKELGVSEKEVTDKFIKAYNDDRFGIACDDAGCCTSRNRNDGCHYCIYSIVSGERICLPSGW